MYRGPLPLHACHHGSPFQTMATFQAPRGSPINRDRTRSIGPLLEVRSIMDVFLHPPVKGVLPKVTRCICFREYTEKRGKTLAYFLCTIRFGIETFNRGRRSSAIQ